MQDQSPRHTNPQVWLSQLGHSQEQHTERSPDDPQQGSSQGVRGFVAWLFVIALAGVLPAAVLIYWGYIAPLTPTCQSVPMVHGQICDLPVVPGSLATPQSYTYAQAVTYEMFRQWVDRVIGPVWALVTLSFIVARVRQRAFERAPDQPPQAPVSSTPSGGTTYRRGRLLGALRTVGIVICALGVLALLFVHPEIF